MMKNKILKFLILIIIIFSSFNVFAKDKNIETEEKDFFSKQIVSENINNGVKVTLVKSDVYGNNQDQYTAVDIEVINMNPYANLDCKITAIDHDEFKTIGGNSRNINLSNSGSDNFSFNYEFKNPTKPYKGSKLKNNYTKSLHIDATESIIKGTGFDEGEKLYREREDFESEEKISEDIKTNKKSKIWLIALVIIIFVVLIFLIYFIRRYIKSNEDIYQIGLIIGLSIILSICVILDKPVYALNQQTFEYNIPYSDTYKVEVYHQGRKYNFSFLVSYMFYGTKPIFDEELDSDNDGLTDNFEVHYMTDRFNSDSDNDGINDYDEIYIIDTDPLNIDTDNNKILDGEEDFDKDGLSNIYELTLGTKLNENDTDFDGLIDGDEITIYHTDPLNVDTDNDGITDYEEVEVAKKLGISDINSVDKNTRFQQVLNRNSFDPELYMDNVIGISISGNLYGLIDKHINVEYKTDVALDNNETILGKIAYISSDYNEPIEVIFDISNYDLKTEFLKVASFKDGKIILLPTNISGTNISAKVIDSYVFVIDSNRYMDEILAFKKDNYS